MRYLICLCMLLMLFSSSLAFADYNIPMAPVSQQLSYVHSGDNGIYYPSVLATQGKPRIMTVALDTGNGAVTLLYKFVPGQDLDYTMVATTSGTMNINGRSLPLTQSVSADYHQITRTVDASGDGTIQVLMKNPSMTITANGQKIPFTADQTQKLLDASSNITMVMSPQGKLISMKSNAPAAAGGMDISKMMSPGSMTGSLTVLPDHAVNIGDFWRGSVSMPAFGLNTYLKMTLNGVSILTGSNVAQIALKTYSTFAPNTKTTPNAPAMTGQMNGQGILAFDVDNGYQKSLKETINIDMVLSPSMNAAANTPPVSGTIALTSKISMNLQNVSVDPANIQAATPPPTNPAPSATPSPTPAPSK